MIKLSQNWEAVLCLMAIYKRHAAENRRKAGMSCTLTNNGCSGSFHQSNKIRIWGEIVKKKKEKTKLQIFICNVSLTLNTPRTWVPKKGVVVGESAKPWVTSKIKRSENWEIPGAMWWSRVGLQTSPLLSTMGRIARCSKLILIVLGISIK